VKTKSVKHKKNSSGRGIFETMRAYRGRVVYLKEHLNRLRCSARALGLACPYSETQLSRIIRQAIKKSRIKDVRVRLVLREKDLAIEVKEYQPPKAQKYRKGFTLAVSPFRQKDFRLARFKTTERALYEKSLAYARKKGFDEALILNSRGNLAEASRSNIFFVKGGNLYTPALTCGCLEGVTRKAIFGVAKKQKIKLCQGNFTLQDLRAAEEAFLTNSLIGVMPVRAVEKKTIGQGRCGKVTALLRKKYLCLLK
jgi:branched-subunit amino acid aminotransferase/4-amino-4-deoxychorismate lyase